MLSHFFGLVDFVEEVAVIGDFHDDAEGVGRLVEEGVFVADDELALDGGQNADFVQGTFLLLVVQRGQLHLFQRVLSVVDQPFH